MTVITITDLTPKTTPPPTSPTISVRLLERPEPHVVASLGAYLRSARWSVSYRRES